MVAVKSPRHSSTMRELSYTMCTMHSGSAKETQSEFNDQEFSKSFVNFMFILFSFITKMFQAIFSTLTRPTELKLAHSIKTCQRVNILLNSFVDAIMIITEGRDGPPNKIGHIAQCHSDYLYVRTYVVTIHL